MIGRKLSANERRSDRQRGTRNGFSLVNVFAAVCILMILAILFLPAPRRTRGAARRSQCKNNLKQITIALYNYEATYGSLPPAFTVDADGKPLHSWRTLILPFLDQQPLYETINLSKPWDHPVNAAALATPIYGYSCPSSVMAENHTTYMAIVGPTGCFSPTEPRPFSDITDGTSHTMMLIEVTPDQAIPWMMPQDSGHRFALSFGPETKTDHAGGVHVALADGSVRFLSASVSKAQRQALLTIAGEDNAGQW